MNGPYPSKVRRILARVERASRPWENVTVETNGDGVWWVRAERPGNVFTQETLRIAVYEFKARVIAGDIKIRASQRFAGGTIYRFGDDVKIATWRDMYKVN